MCPKSFDKPQLGKNYLLDLVAIIKEEAFRGIGLYNKSQLENEENSEWDKGYLRGYAHAYSRVISIMIQQTDTYNIPLAELGLDDIDPDKDLLPGV